MWPEDRRAPSRPAICWFHMRLLDSSRRRQIRLERSLGLIVAAGPNFVKEETGLGDRKIPRIRDLILLVQTLRQRKALSTG